VCRARRGLRGPITAEGYLPARGDRSAFAAEDAIDVMRAYLQRGWQRDVVVREKGGARAIEGAAIVVDGLEVGRTDASGMLRVTRDEAPRTIAVRLSGWTIADGGIDP
jgi:hypothetical protein